MKEQNQHVEALRKFDECQVIIKGGNSEINHDQLQSVYNEIALVCNVIAMQRLQTNDTKLPLELLKKAELFTEHNDRMRATTYNNFACYFRKTNQLRNALTYLEMALELEYRCINAATD